ncbi:UDP-N-acetylmuramoyl-L-alanine--D-glutamate ligase [Roseococcus sp. SDR]|uniref:UDP-N-acetylmuramoyl-L-alanine--D-glutamate ligase n=1 Tax=Roseococcus sp. SDR TaxID=2835532 RepID=UPI001BCD4E9B|nr:UDP-N-acetylmuramoyl-L-alanine--D-glutamate ligase [Roseococcus sp. SDR]MBS7793098.1 UDP-N-acetylmuramoyl-L-alanine--D-glutamate ligase [Roseococcus sp. SDR]MBV1848412.1 UDP-N-acetylmuramoyl-L-alanine--D-glutamate ligase [Roseococcus sp. SDR]
MTPFAGQRVAVVGLGKAGLPAARRLREWGADVTCWDDGEAARAEAAALGLHVADPALGFDFDALLLSPGIPHILPRVHPAAAAARAAGKPILADVEFLFRAVRAAGSRARFVGITGTNGKSTTTALLGHLLERAGVPVEVGGNLGPAALDMRILGDDGVYVLEMSSYMLERIADLRFNAAAMLNLSPDHLDRHGDMAGYRAAKARIFARQTREDVAVLGQDDDATASLRGALTARCVPVSGHAAQPGGIWAEGALLRDDQGMIADLAACPTLPGAHNAQNAAAASALALALGLPRAGLAQGLATYPGLPHRQEQVGRIGAVRFVNDSKATNADSAARALASYDRILWIAGGMGKEGGIAPLAEYFPRIAEAFLIGRDAPEFAATLAAHGVAHRMCGTLAEAVPAAAAAAKSGAADVVLLSPAAASWDQFTGFDARGDAFRALVRALPGVEF